MLSPGHGLEPRGLGGVVGDRRLFEDGYAGTGFRGCWLLGTGGRGGKPSPARALSGVEGVDDTLSPWRRATTLPGLLQGPCAVDFARVCGSGETLCVGVHSCMGTLSPPFLSCQSLMVCPPC